MSVESLLAAKSRSSAELDRFAWDAICNWSKHTSINTIYSGIDYSELIRCFLWDKVARAIRKQVDPKRFEFEQAILDRRSLPKSLASHPNRLKFWLKRSYRSFQTWQEARSLQSRSILYVPCFHPTLQTIVSDATQMMSVVAPQNTFREIETLKTIRPPLSNDRPPTEKVRLLYQGILEGVQAFGIELLESDTLVLQHQIAQLFLRTQQIETELSILRPSAILLFADNHFPVQSYVFVARKFGIPTIMLQHGLDCEHYCLDQAYADVISVWGMTRLQRYQQDSIWQPTVLQVNGNPEYDCLTPPDQLNLKGDYWLWATRPHCPEKCFSPSRLPQEGTEILIELLAALERSPNARLVIKPHPLDDLDLYRPYLNERVSLSSEPIRSLFPNASVVISEDSTVGLEAMFFGKVVIHAHFAASDPVIPYVEYNAALPGYSQELLQTSLQKFEHLTEEQQRTLLTGQRRFLQTYSGSEDGTARSQVLSMIHSVLKR